MKDITLCEGYQKLIESVNKDITGNCFNPNGCDKPMGHCKCSNRVCDKFAWIIDRAKHYADKTGIEAANILNAWEAKRTYWYMNYYQDSNQPEIKNDNVRIFETIDDYKLSIGDFGFRCPLCGGVSKNPHECDSGIIVKKVKDDKDGVCNWKAYGLFGTMGKGITIFIKDQIRQTEIFMPVAWEMVK